MGFLDSIKNIGRGRKSAIGIDIGSSSIKVVQVARKGGKAVLETYGSLAVGPYAERDIGEAVNASEEVIHTALNVLMREGKITTRLSGISIPFKSSLISLIEVPDLPDDKLAQAIPYEARKHIPVPIEEVSIDWFVIPSALLEVEDSPIIASSEELSKQEVEPKRKVLLIAIHNKELLRYKKLVSQSDLNVKFFEIEIFSTLRSVVYENRFPILIIDIGAKTTKFYILEHGIILRSYFINQGGQNMTNAIKTTENITFKEAEKKKRELGIGGMGEDSKRAMGTVIKEISSEANNAIVDFEHKYKQSVGKVIFTGGGSALKGLQEYVKDEIPVATELSNPFARLEHPVFLSETLRETGPEFSVAVGAALRMLDS